MEANEHSSDKAVAAPCANGQLTPSGIQPAGTGGWLWRFWTGASRDHQRCEECGSPLVLAGLRSGARARCGHCGSVFRVPGSSSGPSAGDGADIASASASMEQSPLKSMPAENAPAGSESATRKSGTRLEPPKEIGPYQLEGEIARGGTAIVYKGKHRKLGKEVAVKLLLPQIDSGPEMERRLFREALALARFRHPHIVPVLDAGLTAAGLPYLVMELVDGEDLGRRISRDGPMEWQTALEVLIQVGEAVDFAHAHGVIHRDLKPANVLLDQHGRAQLVDFGLARDEGGASRLTATGIALGTPAYMPPEQARGQREQVGRRADLYSLGAILYEMLTGRPPFNGDTVMEVLYRVVHDQPEAPRRLKPNIPADVEAVCMRLLEKDPRNRYASAYQLLEDLRACLAGSVPPTACPGRTPAMLRFLRRSGWRAALLAVAVLAGLAYIGTYQATSRRANETIERGQELLDQGKYAEAETQFSEAQNLRPKSAAAFIGRQEARQRLRESEEAKEARFQKRRAELVRQITPLIGDPLQTSKLNALIASLLQQEHKTTPPGMVRCEFDSPVAGLQLRVLPLVGEKPVFESQTPTSVALPPGMYRLRSQYPDGREGEESLLEVVLDNPLHLSIPAHK